jgi:hypothetical protein
MQATRSDVFALKKSGLDAFLYADVGAEANGSKLTILSILARLGKDPWAEAARWAALPKATVIDSLAHSIAEMPLAPSDLAGARDSAARLVELLPTNTPSLHQGNATQSTTPTPTVVPIPSLYLAFAVWMALSLLLSSKPSSDVPAPTDNSIAAPGANHPATRSLAKQAALAGSSAIPDHQ